MPDPPIPASGDDRALAADVARFTHETANLLTAMLAHVELLLRTGNLDEHARSDALTLLDSTRQVLKMVYDLGARAGSTRRHS